MARSDLNLFTSRHWELAGHVDGGLFVQQVLFTLFAFFDGLLLPLGVFFLENVVDVFSLFDQY